MGKFYGVYGKNGTGKTTWAKTFRDQDPLRIFYAPSTLITTFDVTVGDFCTTLGVNVLSKSLNLDLNKKIIHLSGGERQGLLLERALQGPEEFVILDETLAQLDFDAAHEFLMRIRNACSCGKTVYWIAHDPRHFIDHVDAIFLFSAPFTPQNAKGYTPDRSGVTDLLHHVYPQKKIVV